MRPGSEHRRGCRLAGIGALMLATGALAWSGCGEEPGEQAGPAPEATGEASAPAGERAPEQRADRPGREAEEAETTTKPSGREATNSQLSPAQVEELRRRIRQGREQASERADEIRRVVEEARESGDLGALEELRDRIAAGRDRQTPPRRVCGRPQAPEEICEEREDDEE